MLPDDSQSPGRDVRAAPVHHEDPGQQILEDEQNGPLGLPMEWLGDLLQAGVGVEGQGRQPRTALRVPEIQIGKT